MIKRKERIKEKAHDLRERPRTEDVLIEDNINFCDLLLSELTLKGLEASGFVKPSPIQRKAIPLGKCGFDLIAQAKSGTGKTCVFSVVALEMVETQLDKLQVLILSPTREISVQIKDVISSIGRFFPKLKVEAFIGGLSLENDKKKLKKCQIAVGAPGRVKHLISDGLMNVNAVRLFVLDEADKLMEDSFREDVSLIYLKLPAIKQMIAASATFPTELEDFVSRFMTNPVRVSPGKDIFLVGIRQFVSVIPSHLSVLVQMKKKVTELKRILSMIPFKQCLVFSNYQSRAESICKELNKEGWPAIYISGSQKQSSRLEAMSALKEFRCRVLLSTDLSSRGIDAENVNLIINLDLPYDGATYMHRIGRAGRYGTFGLAITIVQSGSELNQFRQMLDEIGCRDIQVSLFPEGKLESNIWESKDEDFEKISAVNEKFQTLTIEDSQIDAGKPGSQDDEEEGRRIILNKLFECRLSIPEKPTISEYDDLIKAESEFQESIDSEVETGYNKLTFEDFSPEMKFSFMHLEKNNWEKYKKKIQNSNNALNPEPLEVHEFKRKGAVSEDRVSEENYVGKSDLQSKNEMQDLEEKNEQETEFEDEDVDDEDDEDDEDDIDADDESDNCNDLFENNEEQLSWEAKNNEFKAVRNSLYINQWYSMWYSQLYAIRHYTNYLKHCLYWNEMLKHKR